MSAIFTLLYDPSYLAGALVLGVQLEKLCSEVTRGVILANEHRFSTHQVSLLRQAYHEVVTVESLRSQEDEILHFSLKRPELAETFNKVHLWALPYHTVLYIDCDTLPVTGNNGKLNDLLSVDFPVGSVMAAPDSGFPDIFNSGVLVLHPNPRDFLHLSQRATESGQTFDGADQGLLNQYFNEGVDWIQGQKSNWIKIPFLYNVTPSLQYEYLPAYHHFYHQVKLIHFIGSEKPWKVPVNTQSTDWHKDWWNAWKNNYGDSIEAVLYPEKVQTKNVWNDQNQTGDQSGWEERTDSTESAEFPPQEPAIETEPFHGEVEHCYPESDYQAISHYLIDPQNYQDFPDTIQHSTDSQWDATTEAPPISTDPVVHVTDLEASMRSFVSVWDVEDQPNDHESHEENELNSYGSEENTFESESATEKVVSEGADEWTDNEPNNSFEGPPCSQEKLEDHPPIPLTALNYTYVKPERVFDDDDYFPQHKLQEQEEPIEEEPEEEPEEDEKSDEETDDGVQEIEAEEFVDEIEEAVIENAIYVQPMPKIFPWEFRDQPVPERVWD